MKKLLSTTYYKLCAMFGGAYMLPLVYLLLSASFFAVALIMRARAPQSITVAAVDECRGEYSAKLMDALEKAEGMRVEEYGSAEAGEDALLAGHAEALLKISPRYDELLLRDGSSALISLESAPGAVSSELIREAAAGILAAQRAAAIAEKELEADGFDSSKMQQYIDEFTSPVMYRIETVGGASTHERALFGSSYACYEGVAAFAVFLLLLTLSRRLVDGSSRLVARRMRAAKGGRPLAFFTDAFALFAAGLIALAIAYLLAPDKSPALALGFVCYDVCITGLCLLTSKFGAAGRIDIAAPAIALVTSLIGGCFMDLASLSPFLTVLSRLTPQGQLIACARGALPFAALLAAEGALLAGLAAGVENARLKK